MVEPSIPALTDLRSLPSSSGLLQRSVGPSEFQGTGEEDEVMPNQTSLTQELHLHDARSFNTVQVAYVGIDHAEFGRVVRLIGEADSRASHFEGVAQQVFQEATAHIGYLTSLVEELRSQNEMLQTGHTEKDVMITSLHEAVQEVKQTLENQIKFNQSMFEGQLRKAKDEIDRLSDLNQKSLNLLGHKDSEIQRLCQESSSRQTRSHLVAGGPTGCFKRRGHPVACACFRSEACA